MKNRRNVLSCQYVMSCHVLSWFLYNCLYIVVSGISDDCKVESSWHRTETINISNNWNLVKNEIHKDDLFFLQRLLWCVYSLMMKIAWICHSLSILCLYQNAVFCHILFCENTQMHIWAKSCLSCHVLLSPVLVLVTFHSFLHFYTPDIQTCYSIHYYIAKWMTYSFDIPNLQTIKLPSDSFSHVLSKPLKSIWILFLLSIDVSSALLDVLT